MDIDYTDELTFGDGIPCLHRGCRNHVSHACEICGRIACRGVARVRTGWLRVWKEEEIVEEKNGGLFRR